MRGLAVATAVVLFAFPLCADEQVVRGRVVDDGGHGVANAELGTRWVAGDGFQGPDDERLTDEEGRFEVISSRPADQVIPVMARNPEGTHFGLALIVPNEVEQPVSIPLQQAVTLRGHVFCREIDLAPSRIDVDLGVVPDSFPEQPVDVGTTDNLPLETLAAIDDAAVRLYELTSDAPGFSFKLPPGRYWLRFYVLDMEDVYLFVTLPPGQAELDLGSVDMPLAPLAKLYGKPAPDWTITEARGIDAGSRVSDFRGKWVLLEFWGHWCGPCVIDSLPRLARFYRERREDHDRFEVVAVHHRDADTLEELDEKLEPIQEKYWENQPLPFPIIVDATDETVEAYGISAFPTAVVIDPEGKVSRIRSATELGAILDGTLLPGENRAVGAPVERPEPPPATPLASDHFQTDDFLRCEGHAATACAVDFAPGGDVFVTGGQDARLIVWDAASGRQKRLWELSRGIIFTSQGVPTEVLPDNQTIVSVSYERRESGYFRSPAFYGVKPGIDGGVGLTPPSLAHILSIGDLAVSADGKTLMMSQWDDALKTNIVTAWSLRSGDRKLTWFGDAQSLAVSPDGGLVAIGGGGHPERPTQVCAFETKTGELVWEQEQPGWSVIGLAFSSDGTRLASVAWDEAIVVREAGSGEVIQTLRQPGHRATAVAFSPDGGLLATGGAWPFRGVRLWDLNQGTLRATLVGHDESEVKGVAFSPDGRKLVSVGGRSDSMNPDGGQVYLWNLERLFR